jgi:16S rRNA (cytosine967-C5)-methyltransferase
MRSRAPAQIGGEHVRPFANAVLRNYQRRREVLLANAAAGNEGRFSHADWWIEKLKRDYGADADRILNLGNQHPPMALRANVRRANAEDYLRSLQQAGLRARSLDSGAILLERPVPVESLPGFGEGKISVQDAGAQLAAPLLDIRQDMRVLDACAAPGGKTAHILELANVAMTALDADAVRLQAGGQES